MARGKFQRTNCIDGEGLLLYAGVVALVRVGMADTEDTVCEESIVRRFKMARRKYSKGEIRQWQEEHHQNMFYINKNDSNMFVIRRSGLGGTLNLTHPGAWIIIAAIIALVVVLVVFRKAIFG
jgi:uncharacterized membrane protein